MPVRNAQIAEVFDELADLLDIEEANPFRVRAYRNAARTIREHPQSMSDLLAAGRNLDELPGIGKDLAGKIATIVETGTLPLLEEVASRTPRALSQLLEIESLGPKRVKTLYRTLGIRTLEDVRRAAELGRIRDLPGFGRKTEELIREGVERLAGRSGRMMLPEAEELAARVTRHLEGCKGLGQLAVAGSYRRRKETVGDLDVLVTATGGAAVIDHFVAFDEVAEIISKGTTRSTVRLRSGTQVDLRLVPPASFGAALLYFTGSKAHNIAVRRIAIDKGYKVNEYGVFRGEKRVAGRTEAEVYRRMGLDYVPPELREDRGEIEAARAHRLPNLVTLADLRGDLHCHTTESDGRAALEQMVRAAGERGYEYISINDHSQRVAIAHGLDERRLRKQLEAIDALNARLRKPRVLKSVEVDILEDGSLDLPDRILRELDFTVCAVHYQLGLSAERQTARILRAMDNPCFNILAHPTGRLINERPPYAVHLERLLEGAKQRGCFVELNGRPDRLDLNDEACKLAKEIGVRVAISTDAHDTADLGFMRYGVDQARRGWLEAADVINTRPWGQLRRMLRR